MKALTFAADLAKKYDAELLIVHVVIDGKLSDQDRHLLETEYATEIGDRIRQLHTQTAEDVNVEFLPQALLLRHDEAATIIRDFFGERLLSSAEESAREIGASKVNTTMAHGDPAKMILAIAEESHVDLIALGSRGSGEWRALLLGSVSSKVAHMAHCSVTLVR
ncbi:universal stress protein [Microvirga sp. BT350]|uniref:Universal stress protein n=1 Tax=Microvirga alba TaxID=2791025 RepID=A0A931BKH6_9HYPH|nr:universal stress protein [Microvirga alba]